MWKVPDIISDPKYTVNYLKSNKNYRFRVASVNNNGRGKLSNDVVKKALRQLSFNLEKSFLYNIGSSYFLKSGI